MAKAKPETQVEVTEQDQAEKAAAKAAEAAKKAAEKEAKAIERAEKKAAKEAEKAAAAAEKEAAKAAKIAEKEAAQAAREAERQAKIDAKAAAKAAREANKMPEQNGIRRPSAEGVCGQVWNLADEISGELGQATPIANLLERTNAQSIDQTTARVQYARWKKFHGLSGKITLPTAAE